MKITIVGNQPLPKPYYKVSVMGGDTEIIGFYRHTFDGAWQLATDFRDCGTYGDNLEIIPSELKGKYADNS